MKTMPNELKPCPFCGGKAVIDIQMGSIYVTALHKRNCVSRPDTWLHASKSLNFQIKLWNRRADNGNER